MNSSVGERSSHPSVAQVKTLIKFLEERPNLAKGISKNAGAKVKDHKDWEKLTLKLNSINRGATKSSKQWIKYWADKKSAVKKKAAARNTDRQQTGDEFSSTLDLSEIEERILSLSGGESLYNCDRSLHTVQVFEDDLNTNQRIEYENSSLQNIFNEDNLAQPTSSHETETPPPYTSHCPRFKTSRKLRKRRIIRTEPSFQWRSQFLSTAKKFLQLEETRLDLSRRVVSYLESTEERDRLIARGMEAMGEGMKSLADAINRGQS